MITPRPKIRMDDAAPVLFRLPNLRTRGSRPKASENVAAGVPNETTFAVDAIPQSAPLQHGMQSSAQSPRIGREFDFAENVTVARGPVLETPKASGNASSSPAIPASVVSEASPVVPSLANDPMGRSWMEQVGSRMILIVTLLVIVSAAWVTGTRMPASKPGNRPDDQVAQNLDPNARSVQLPEVSTGELNAEIDIDTKSRTDSMLAGSDKMSNTSEASSQPDLVAPGNQQVEQNPEASLSGASSGSQSFSNVTRLLPPSGHAPEPVERLSATSSDIANLNPSIALKPPVGLEPPASLGSLFYTAEDTPVSSGSIPVNNVSIQTRTPVAPSIDPNVLVPWANENEITRTHRPSATPNPISDWSQYLPGTPPSSEVRTTSATQSPTDPSARQAIYQPSTTPAATIK